MRSVRGWWHSLSYRTRRWCVDWPLAVGVAAALTWFLVEVLSR